MYAFSGKMHRRNFNGIRRELFQWNLLHTMPILFKTLLWYSSLKFEKGKYFPYTFVHKVFCIEFCTGHRRGTGTYQCTLVKCFCIVSLLSAREEEPVPLIWIHDLFAIHNLIVIHNLFVICTLKGWRGPSAQRMNFESACIWQKPRCNWLCKL